MIQDACQAHGARCAGRPLTHYSPYVAYSFYPTKNLGCLGDGGALATSSRKVGRSHPTASRRRPPGRSCERRARRELQARRDASLLSQRFSSTEWNARRAHIAALYDEALADCAGVRPVRRGSDSVHHLYVIRAKHRAKLQTYLQRRGIGSGVHYPVPLYILHRHLAIQRETARLPHAERAARGILSLPIWPYLSDADAARVALEIQRFYTVLP